MNIWSRTRGGVVIALGLVAIAALTACSGSSGSRHALYDSIDSLAADSSVIVVGTVQGHHTDGGESVSTIDVSNVPANPQLGANLDGKRADVSVGDVIEVREAGETLLAPGGQYLLFLTPTVLSGPAADQYFITGAGAGLYERDGDQFRRVAHDTGDALPDTITIAD